MIKHLKQVKTSIVSHFGSTSLAALMMVPVSLGYPVSTALAQTDFNIQSQSGNLKAEFQKELDKWMLRAYEGDRDAQFKVGVLFANDQFGPPDHEQSAYWYKQAARQGHVLSQYNLGHQYLTGAGVKRDEKTAMQWWLKAAQQQHALAQFNVGRAYYLGIGLDKDHSQAKLWFERASQNNEPKSTELLKQLGWWDENIIADVEQPVNADEPTAALKNSAGASTDITSTDADNNIINELGSDVTANEELVSDSSKIENVSKTDQSDISNNQTAAGLRSKIEAISTTSLVTTATSNNDSDADTNNALPDDARSATIVTPQAANTSDDENLKAQTQVKARVQANVQAQNTQTQSNPAIQRTITVFTNPAVRSVLITIVDDALRLNVLDEDATWTTVNMDSGFPVWVSKNFVRANNGQATITAQSVNARSVPLITKGSVVGRFDKGETAIILGERNDWYRLRAPKRFKGWVKSSDLLAIKNNTIEPATDTASSKITEGSDDLLPTLDTTPLALETDQPKSESASASLSKVGLDTSEIQQRLTALPPTLNDNEWLYAQNEGRYALQLASFNDIDSTERFINSLSFANSSKLRLFTTKSNDGVDWTYVMYGSYDSKDRAKKAANSLKQKRAWIRSVGVLQQNRCIAWKKELPAPKELNKYCK